MKIAQAMHDIHACNTEPYTIQPSTLTSNLQSSHLNPPNATPQTQNPGPQKPEPVYLIYWFRNLNQYMPEPVCLEN